MISQQTLRMLFRIHFQVFLLSLFLPHLSSAQATLPYQQDKLESYIAEFKLDSAQQLVPSIHHAGLEAFYTSNILIYKFLGTQHPTHLKKLDDSWNNTVEQIGKMAETDTLKEVLLSDLYCKRATIAFLNGNYLAAVKYTRTGRKLIQKNEKKYGDHIGQMKIRGLFNILLGSVPAKYHWITHTLGYYGDVQKGQRQLEKAAKFSKLLHMEAFLVSCFVEKNMLNHTERALSRLLKMRKRTGPNIVLDFVLATGYMHDKQNEEAIRILSLRNQYVGKGIFFYSLLGLSTWQSPLLQREPPKCSTLLIPFFENT